MEKKGDDFNPTDVDLWREKQDQKRVLQTYYGNVEDFFYGGDLYAI